MRRCFSIAAVLFFFLIQPSPAQASDCLPFTEAPKRVGETVCVTGKVVKVHLSEDSGTHFLNFCEDYRTCAFTVVVFSRDLNQVGDVLWLEGREIRVRGEVKMYQGRAEIILRNVRQLDGEAATLPPVPRAYDARVKGKFSAGNSRPTTKAAKQGKKPSRKGKSDSPGEAEPTDPQD